jgi:hypothetical protein
VIVIEQPLVGGDSVFDRCRKGVFRREPIVDTQRTAVGTVRDVTEHRHHVIGSSDDVAPPWKYNRTFSAPQCWSPTQSAREPPASTSSTRTPGSAGQLANIAEASSAKAMVPVPGGCSEGFSLHSLRATSCARASGLIIAAEITVPTPGTNAVSTNLCGVTTTFFAPDCVLVLALRLWGSAGSCGLVRNEAGSP